MSGGLMRCVESEWGFRELVNFVERHYGSAMAAQIRFVGRS
jgi:hypothetical protein